MSDDIIAAASLIVLRERAGAAPDILIVRRGAALTFAGGAYAFPGGRVDAGDRLLAARHLPDHDPDDSAARIAAARETWEETAVVVGRRAIGAGDMLPPGAAASGLPLDGATLDHDAFVPFARWLPPAGGKRRFDTRFYLAQAPVDAEPRADGTETTEAFWATAEEILARCRAGDGSALFPTRRLLERIASLPTFAAARAHALALPPLVITPRVERRDGVDWLCIPDDAGYPVTAERLDNIRRA
ncbi:NUDIX hydrolase [uncultured Sphingomonas sp.]|uniref:NUDIX hydrolase n=1 Tax=uncultured Sphingomonas sp. TaxID=158754 RepID=UPI0035CC7BE3